MKANECPATLAHDHVLILIAFVERNTHGVEEATRPFLGGGFSAGMGDSHDALVVDSQGQRHPLVPRVQVHHGIISK